MDKRGTLQVRGTANIKVAPDEAIVHLRVVTEGKTANEAVESNAKHTQAVVEAVEEQPNHGVTTTGLGVSPIIKYEDGSSTIVGFRATNGIEVKTKPGYAGQIFDAGISAGANQSSGITFRIQNETPHRDEALRVATKEAYREANIVATTADVELKGPETIEVDPGGGAILYRAKALDAKAPATPVIPDDLTISASVRILFRTRG